MDAIKKKLFYLISFPLFIEHDRNYDKKLKQLYNDIEKLDKLQNYNINLIVRTWLYYFLTCSYLM